MGRISLGIFSLVFFFGLLCSTVFALPREEALNHGLSNDDAYAYSLIMKASGAGSSEAIPLLEEALDNAPDSPGFYFTLAVAKLPSLVKSFDLFVEGVKAYGRSFWWRMSLFVLGLEAALFSAAIALSLAALLRFPRDLPLLVHDINEHKVLLLLPLMVLPMAYFGPLPFVAGLLFLTCLYMKRTNKLVAYVALLMVALAPLWTDFVAKAASLTNPTVRALVDVNEGRDNGLALATLSVREDYVSRFTYALALKRVGRAEEAVDILQELIKASPNPRLFNNLGNAYVATGQFDLAKSAYLKSIELGETVTSLYNLGQIFRDDLDFENGEKYFKKSQALDSVRVSEYTSRAPQNFDRLKHYNRMVFDETLTEAEITQTAWGSDLRNTIRGFPNGTTIPAALAGVMLFIFIVLDKSLAGRAFRCKNCGAVACTECSESEKMCMDCQLKLSQQDDTSPQARVKRMLQANRQKESQMGVIRGLSFAPPGVAQAYSGRLFSGFVYLWLFCFGVLMLVLNPLMSTGLAGCTHSWLWLVVVPFLVFVYYISVLTVNRRLDRGWL